MKIGQKVREIHHPHTHAAMCDEVFVEEHSSVDVSTFVAKAGLGVKSMKSDSKVLRELDCQN